MKYIFLIIYYFILPVISFKEITPKLCVNCKFFINSITYDNTDGKCSLFPKQENGLHFLMAEIKHDDYYYCCNARKFDDMCGKEGKKYKNKLSVKEHFK